MENATERAVGGSGDRSVGSWVLSSVTTGFQQFISVQSGGCMDKATHRYMLTV